ncbi:MAG: HD domain-containing protein [Candidatus Omnitrophica bacterium]|nr:HD domain-containing protein [Candidatus Omnitrophota bacterium]
MALNSKVLLISDDKNLSAFLREELVIKKGYAVSFEYSGRDGIFALKQNHFEVVLLKYGLIDLEAQEVVSSLKKIDPNCIIIAIIETHNEKIISELFKLGVYDFVIKPIDLEKLSFLIEKGAQLHYLIESSSRQAASLKERNAALEKQNLFLTNRVEESTKKLSRLYEDLRSTYMRTIKVLAQAIDARDHYTHSHSQNVAKYAVSIANEMNLSAKEIENIREACELHDLGKIGVGDSILSKPSILNAQEWEEIKRHPMIAAQILEPLTFLDDVIELIRQHHEHYDGTGYPEGRKGDDILLGSRIIHLADAYEAMRSARSYRKIPLTKEDAILEIKNNSGTQFDPKVVEAFLKVVDTL